MANLLEQSDAGEITADDWENHELAWQAYVTQTREAVVEGSAQIMLAIEAMARHEPEKITSPYRRCKSDCSSEPIW